MKLPCIIKPILFLFFIFLLIMLFGMKINVLFGGHTNCFICTKINYNGFLTNWTVSHFIVFAIAGYLCPTYSYTIFAIGILWELLELFLEYNSRTNNKGFICKNLIPSHSHCDTKTTSKKDFWEHYIGYDDKKMRLYWTSGGVNGALLDILFDGVGIYVGRYLATV